MLKAQALLLAGETGSDGSNQEASLNLRELGDQGRVAFIEVIINCLTLGSLNSVLASRTLSLVDQERYARQIYSKQSLSTHRNSSELRYFYLSGSLDVTPLFNHRSGRLSAAIEG